MIIVRLAKYEEREQRASVRIEADRMIITPPLCFVSQYPLT